MSTKKKKPAPRKKPGPKTALDTGRPVIDDRHERFLQEYIAADQDAVKAYRRVYTKVTTDRAARSAAARLLSDVNIRQRLRHLLFQRYERNQLDAQATIRELANIATADPADVFDFFPNKKADGFVTLRSPSSIPAHARRTIAAIRSTPVTGPDGRVRYNTLLRAAGVFRELSDLETLLAGLPPKFAAQIRRLIEGESQAAQAGAGVGGQQPGRMAYPVEVGPGAPVQADGTDPGPVAAGVPLDPVPAEGPAVLPPGGEVDDLGGLDLSALFDDP
jgi:hypothetical protein